MLPNEEGAESAFPLILCQDKGKLPRVIHEVQTKNPIVMAKMSLPSVSIIVFLMVSIFSWEDADYGVEEVVLGMGAGLSV